MTEWWRDAVVYEVYLRSFADANGDGEGDLPGLRSKLTYLHQLGVDAIWLTPFYPSPMSEGGYDVADYRDIDPRFGTFADLDGVLADAHRLGMRVLVDIVPNHSSVTHPWFVDALTAPPGSAARDRYVFSDAPNDWRSMLSGSAWTRVPDGQYYLHLFDSCQPDYNWRNPEVRAEFESILRFWLDRGVDGFRIDVAHALIKAADLPSMGHDDSHGSLNRIAVPYFDQEEVHDIYRGWRKILDSYPGDRVAVAEALISNPTRLARYVRADELHLAFNFDLMTLSWSAPDLRRTIDDCVAAADTVGAPTTWVLSSHDRPRHRTWFGGGLARARAATMLMLALPGAACLYQGEELGLPEVLDLPDAARQDPAFHRSGGVDPGRDGCRVPIPWSGPESPFGFTTGTPWLPIPASWASLSVQAQAGDPDSTLSLYQQALRIRRTDLMGGSLTWHDSPSTALHFQRRNGLRCIVNLGPALALPTHYGDPLLSSGPLCDGALPTDTAVWFGG